MNTIKEMALSASHLGGEDGGMGEWWEENKEGGMKRKNRRAEGFLSSLVKSQLVHMLCVWNGLVIHFLFYLTLLLPLSSSLIPPFLSSPLFLLSVSSAKHQEDKRQ